MKFGQFIEYDMGKVFLGKLFTKCVGEGTPRPYYKKRKLSISLHQQSKMLYGMFSFYIKVEVYQNILKLKC